MEKRYILKQTLSGKINSKIINKEKFYVKL